MKNVCFSADSGFCTAVLGDNGAGKSTLLKAVGGVLRPLSGRAELNGIDIYSKKNTASLRGKIGFVPQNDMLFEDLSASDNILFWARAAGVKKHEVFSSPIFNALNLVSDYKKKAAQLSGGNRKKCAIAAAAVSNPLALVLDEPFAHLDAATRRELSEFLLGLKAIGTAIIITSHNAREVSALCERYYFIRGGELQKISGAEKFFNDDNDDFDTETV